jgi:NADH-quinone oxidoreductase subunit N
MNAIIAIAVLTIVVLFLGVRKQKGLLLPLILIGLPVAMFLTLKDWNTSVHYFNEMYIADNFSLSFNAVLIFTTFVVFMFAAQYYRSVERPLEDIYALILFALIGALIMTSFGDLIMLFIGMETLSISLYILAGSKKFDPASNEAAMKYFLTGSFSTGFLLFGIALVYGASGSFNLAAINSYINANTGALPNIFMVGMLFIFIGMAFKIAAVPFHFWAPDVYAGSPTLITAFMATAGKVAGIAAFYRFTSLTFVSLHETWVYTLMFFSAATIIVGNLSAISQDNLKRMFAYSGIAQAGYLMLAVIALGPKSAGALLYYSLSYSLSTITGFAIVMLIREEFGTFSIDAFKGLARNNRIEAFAMAVAMLSLAGIPPLAGFMAKYNIFLTAMHAGYVWLVVLAVIGSMISIYYYFRPIIAMYFNNDKARPKISTSKVYKAYILFCTILIILLGLLPNFFIDLLN